MENLIAGKFYKISREAYEKIVNEDKGNTEFVSYDDIILPKRSTSKSLGYDFFLPNDITINPNESVVINTFIKCNIYDGWGLAIVPRSGLGFKYQLSLANTIGIIDPDYFNNEGNEGHIMIKLVNRGDQSVTLPAGTKFCQGLFNIYGITNDEIDNDEDAKIRTGGLGSTGL